MRPVPVFPDYLVNLVIPAFRAILKPAVIYRCVSLENSSVARIFAKTGRSLSLLKIMTPRGVLVRGGALASAKFVHGVHAAVL